MIVPLALLIALGPWSGPDLPTGAPDTIKYKLTVNGDAGSDVKLRSGPVPKDWIASFCTQRVCAPFKTSITLPASGTYVIEFQLIPPDQRAKRAVTATVFADDGFSRATASSKRSGSTQ
ncbi:MAG TPA: hypothetical protein VN905_14180 [Candidatus Binatia bacterium]|nr:hypothetical protein [Candidatus Binatia bacterium]